MKYLLISALKWKQGRGKTYVYLRTIYELNKQYGFLKFVIVGPSIAIREGVIKNLPLNPSAFHRIPFLIILLQVL